MRDYLPDDDIRQVNWRATERLGRPMSNTYRVERDRDVLCVIDSGRLMAAPLRDRTRLDAAVDAAVAVAAVAEELGDRCGVLAFDREIAGGWRRGARGADAVVRALFDLEPRPFDSDYELAFRYAGEAKRAFVLVFTDLLEEAAARPLLAALPLLARRHSLRRRERDGRRPAGARDGRAGAAGRGLPRRCGCRGARRPRARRGAASPRRCDRRRGAGGRARGRLRQRLSAGEGSGSGLVPRQSTSPQKIAPSPKPTSSDGREARCRRV